jgi:hypothetical protein
MSLTYGLLLVLTGTAMMGFGLLIYYAWLPVLYGLVGLDLGLLLGTWLTGGMGVTAIVLAAVGAVALACLAYMLEPFRRIFLGLSAGALFGMALADLVGVNRLIGGAQPHVFAIAGAVIGAVLVPWMYRPFIVITSAFAGASMAITGAGLIFPGSGVFDHGSGSFLPSLLILFFGLFGVSWQMKNISKWEHLQPGLRVVARQPEAGVGAKPTPERAGRR